MSILRVQGVSRSFAGVDILRDVDLALEPGERAGLVGPNGSGKTTLLRIIQGELEPDSGRVHLQRGARLGHLEQDPRFEPGATVRSAAGSAFSDLDRLERRLAELADAMARHPADDELLAEFGRVQAQYEFRGGYEREARLDRVLGGLGFSAARHGQPVEELSGGQLVRLGLARLLLASPDVLLLDEPTNHLDIDSIEWLEGYLASAFPGAVLMVSHDRAFLDRTVGVVFAVEEGRVTEYRGNYSAYVRQREDQLRKREEEWRRVEEERRRLVAFIEKYRAGSRSTLAKSREKALARLPEVERPRLRERRMNLRFEPAAASGREVLHVEGLAKAFPGPAGGVLFRGFSAKVRRGERVGLVGPNGSGKTTLLRILAGEARPDEGGLLWGAGVEIGFFDQKLEGLDGRGTVLDEIMGAADFTIGEARSYLARFLFRGDDVDTPVRALSGGERNRLLLARLVISRTNVLLLDEPTNHLDIPAREVLEDALAAFPGTLFFATHDRYLLRLATRLWVFGQGRVIDFRGSYADWEALRAEEAAGERGTGAAGRAAPAGWVAPAGRVASAGRRDSALRTASVGRTDPARGASSPVPGGGPAAGSGDAAEPAPLSKNEARRIRERVAEVEREIGRQEAVLRECEARLSDPALREDGGALLEAGERYAEADRVLGELYEEWERLAGLLQTEDSRGPSQK